MIYTYKYKSPLGHILLAADEVGITGLWFEGQKYFGNTKTKGHNDGTIVLPATLKNSEGQDVKVTAVIKDVKGNVATNNELAPNVYIANFSAEGYKDVSAGVAVTDKP